MDSAIITMVVEDELIAAIVAAPDDDAPRLVLADWLSERGDPRGEHIAIEVALARTAFDAPERAALVERAAALRPSIVPPVVEGATVEFRSARGMIDHAKLKLDVLLARDREIFAVAPLLRSVEITDVDEPRVGALLDRAWFSRLRSLEMSWHVPGEAVIAVARSPAARGLERLSVHHAFLPVLAFAAIGDSEHLEQLDELDLSLCNATDDSVVALLAPHGLSSLTTLLLGNNMIGTAGCQAVTDHVTASLRRLRIGWNRLGHRGVMALAKAQLRPGLTLLDLDHTQAGEKGCAALADANLELEVLMLQQSKVDDAGARHLLRSRSLVASLRALDLRNNALSESVVNKLRTCFGARVHL